MFRKFSKSVRNTISILVIALYFLYPINTSKPIPPSEKTTVNSTITKPELEDIINLPSQNLVNQTSENDKLIKSILSKTELTTESQVSINKIILDLINKVSNMIESIITKDLVKILSVLEQ